MDLTDILSGSAFHVAPRLLGCHMVRTLADGSQLIGRIVETEAYDQTDAASHSHRGNTPRTSVMFGPPGRLYVYFTYGMHYCCNVVTGPEGEGSAVLIRAVEPLQGLRTMAANRAGGRVPLTHDLTNGPAKFCQAFVIDKAMNGHDLSAQPLQLVVQPALALEQIVQTTRVGISRAQDVPWRFLVRGNPFVSVQPAPKQ